MFQRISPFWSRAALICAVCLLTSIPSWGSTIINFEGLADLQPVDNFYTGVTFHQALAVIAGFTLNEAEFPPASGVTVATPDSGPMSMDVAIPVTDFQAQFTHSDTLTLIFLLGGRTVGTVNSTFINNLALSGDLGTSPNETIAFHTDQRFDSVEFTGGGAFTVDNIALDDVPEPGAGTLVACGLILGLYTASRKSRSLKN